MGLISKPNTQSAVLGLLTAALLHPAALKAQQWDVVQPQSKQQQGQRYEASPRSSEPGRSLQWSIMPNQEGPTAEASPTLEPADVENSSTASSTDLNWQPLTAAEIEQQQQAIQQEIEQAQERIENPTIVVPPSGPTYANFLALWRDGDWLPQISNTVPVGFGPQGVMATFTYRALDCTTGAGVCKVPASYQAWQDSIERQGDAYFSEAIGFGDALKSIGIIITNTTQGTAYSGPRGQDKFFGGNQTGFHLSKAFGADTAVRIGVGNWIRWDWPQADLQKNAYGVVSQRVRLGPDDGGWFRNIYLTAGAGNGALRPLDKQIGTQITAQRKAGCYTWNYTPPSKKDCSSETRRKAVRDGGDFGDLAPLGAIGLEVVKGFHLIGEWSGRNLNLGLSFRPFPELGLVITPMFENVLVNSDYGVNVEIPGAPPEAMPSNVLTDRARFSIQASVEVKF